MTDFAPGATAIMSCDRVGDWIVLDCHVNPHFWIYKFFNMYRGDFVFDIQGACLTWRDDDLSTAVYTMFNEVYDIWGHPIDSLQEGELYELTYLDENHLRAKYWIINGETEEDLEKTIEWETVDRPMFAYMEYMLSASSSRWGRFVNMAEEAPAAFVMINPPKMIRDLYYPKNEETLEGALDHIAVVSLRSGETLKIAPEDPFTQGREKQRMEYDADMGDVSLFDVTVPEGMPVDSLVVKGPGGSEARWPIIQISGRDPISSVFVK